MVERHASENRVREPRMWYDVTSLCYIRLRDGAARCAYTGERLGPIRQRHLERFRELAAR